MDYLKGFREQLQSELDRRGWDHREFGKRCDLNENTINIILRYERKFHEGHLIKFETGLGQPIFNLFAPTSEIEKKLQEKEFMNELKECIELMMQIPEFKRGILSRCDELKVIHKEKIEEVKKKPQDWKSI